MTSAPSPSSSSSSYEVDSAALLKILLHAAKQPSSDVLGVLLGRPPKGSDAIDADASSTPTPSVSGRVVDALPLFHGPMLHGPMLEVALLQVRRRKERTREREQRGRERKKVGLQFRSIPFKDLDLLSKKKTLQKKTDRPLPRPSPATSPCWASTPPTSSWATTG